MNIMCLYRLSFRRSLSAGSTVEMVDNSTILSSEVASQMDSNAIQKLRPFKSSFNTANKSLTLSDAELHQCLEDVGRSGSYSDSDIRYVPVSLSHMSDVLYIWPWI